MDSGDLIYFIIIIGASLISAISKKKKIKAQQAQPESAPKRNIFEEFLEMQKEKPDPELQYEVKPFESKDDEYEPEYFEEFGNEPDEVFEEPVFRYSEPIIEEDMENVSVVENNKKQETVKQHHLLGELKKRSEVQKAVLYSEILKPKF